MTLFIHVEEPSMEAALRCLLPLLIGGRGIEAKIIDHGSKQRLLRDLPQRLTGYGQRIAQEEDIRVLVLVDRDDDDCQRLKSALEDMARAAGLPTKSAPRPDGAFRVVNRVVVEELEAWFFGDVPALRAAYERVPETLARQQGYRDPDAITGGTWEKLLHVLQGAGHYRALDRLPKIDVARNVAKAMDPDRNRSRSFRHFVAGLRSLCP